MAKMSFQQLLDTEVKTQEFIDWFRKEPTRDSKAGRAMLKEICGQNQTRKIGPGISRARNQPPALFRFPRWHYFILSMRG